MTAKYSIHFIRHNFDWSSNVGHVNYFQIFVITDGAMYLCREIIFIMNYFLMINSQNVISDLD